MGSFDEFPLATRLFLRGYPWRRIDPVPRARLGVPLTKARVALVSSAGFVLPGQRPFSDTVSGGDASWRVIPDSAEIGELRETHRSESFDHAGLGADPNLAFPLDRLHELARGGEIGGASGRHLSFMGSITAPGRLVRDSAPEMARQLSDDGVDAALLVPV